MSKKRLRLNFGGHRTPIGLDIGARSIKAVQLESSRGEWRIVAASVAPRPHAKPEGAARSDANGSSSEDSAGVSQEVISGLPHLFDRAGFVGNRIVLAAPHSHLLQSVLDLPPRSSNAPIEQLARLELARVHRCAPDTFEMGCWDLPPGGGAAAKKGTHLMAIGLPHARSTAMLDLFDAAGLQVDAIDIASCALARACAPSTSHEAITAMLDIGWGAASLSLLYRGAVIYGRVLVEAGVAPLHGALTRRLGMETDVADYLLTDVGIGKEAGADNAGGAGSAPANDFDLPEDARALLSGHVDAMAKELQVSFSYATHEHPEASVAKLLLVGGGSAIPGFARRLEATLRIPAVAVTPASLVSCEGPLLQTCSSPALILATGLAQFPEV